MRKKVTIMRTWDKYISQEYLRIRKDSKMFNSVNERTPKMNKGERKTNK